MKPTTIGAAFAAFALCAAAGAQTSNPATRPVLTDPTAKPSLIGASARIGFAIPVANRASSAEGNVLFAFGADYTLGYHTPSFGYGDRSYASVSVDYYRKSDFGNIPVLLNYNVGSGAFTLSAGVGVGFGDEPGRSQSNFSYQAGVSFDVASDSNYPVFLQAKFMGSDRNDLNAVGVFLGVRF